MYNSIDDYEATQEAWSFASRAGHRRMLEDEIAEIESEIGMDEEEKKERIQTIREEIKSLYKND